MAIILDHDATIRTELQQLLDKHGNDRAALLPILHVLQNKYHGISSEYMQILADMLHIHAVEIQEVVSFYSFFNIKKKGKYIIRMCRSMPCKMSGAIEVVDQLQKVLGIEFGNTTNDGVFTLEWTNCIGMCDQGPAFLINDIPYTKVRSKNVAEIIKQYRARSCVE